MRITAADLGRRVSVRRRTPTGSATDVVGDLTSVSDDTLTVRDREDTEHEVRTLDVIAARTVTARPVRPSVAALERTAAAGWPAVETERVGTWWLRAAGGFTWRANSALAIGDPGEAFGTAADAVRAWYGSRGLPAAAAVVLPSPEDDGFAALGWSTSRCVLVQIADLSAVSATVADAAVQIHDEPTQAWLTGYTARGDVTETGRRVLTGPGTLGFAQVGDEPAAIGRGVVVDGWLGISAVEVAGHARRRGLGSAVTAALVQWAAGHGAERAYLQVQSDNGPARSLYASLGFRTHHRYRYRIADAPPVEWLGRPES